MRIAVAVLAGMALSMLVAGTQARASGAAKTVVDGTYTCAVFFRGGAYLLDNHAHAGSKRAGSWARVPYAGVHSGVFSGGTGNLLAWITAGKPSKDSMAELDYDSFGVAGAGTLGIRREGCRRTSTAVPLTPAGLRGGAAPALGAKYECFTPKQVVVRVRAVLAARGALRAGPDFQTARVPVREAKLAVRTLAGKPLVYADVSESGKVRLFAAKGCSAQ